MWTRLEKPPFTIIEDQEEMRLYRESARIKIKAETDRENSLREYRIKKVEEAMIAAKDLPPGLRELLLVKAALSTRDEASPSFLPPASVYSPQAEPRWPFLHAISEWCKDFVKAAFP